MAVKLHRYGLPLLLSVWVLLACGCCRMEKTDITEEQLYHGSEISFTTEFSTYPMGTEKFNWTLKNRGKENLGLGNDIALEKWKDDGWYRIPFLGEIRDYLGVVDPGKNWDYSTKSEVFDCRMTEGHYRFIKWIGYYREEYLIAAEFDIV